MNKTTRFFALALLATLATLPAGLARAQAPAPTTGTVASGGANISYRVQGSGPAIMLIHGYPLSGDLFARNRDALSKNYTVITPDLRGFGQSIAPDSNGSVETYAHDMIAVMDKLNVQQAIIGGMSMGGPVVFEMYRQAPQRFRGMILIDTTAAPANLVEQAQWPGFGQQATQKGIPSMIPILMPQMLTGKTRDKNPEEVDFLTSIIKQCSLNGAVGGATTLATRPDSMPTLATITVPTLIIVGQEDPIYSVESDKQMQQAIRGSQIAVVPGASHAAIYEGADKANKAIQNFAKGIK